MSERFLSSSTQQELESGLLLQALKNIFTEDIDNPDVLEKMLWLLTNLTTYVCLWRTGELLSQLIVPSFTRSESSKNKALVGSIEWGFLELLTSLLDFSSEQFVRQLYNYIYLAKG